jgi:HPt (histidine-containing phosphotransfer) domain-containing protein
VNERAAVHPRQTCFDIEELWERVGHDRAVLRTRVRTLLESSDALLASVEGAVRTRNACALEREACRLKRSLLALSAHPAALAAQALEEIGRRAEICFADPAFTHLAREVRQLVEDLRAVDIPTFS